MCIARIENCLIEPGRDVEDCSQDDDVPGDIVSEELSQESSSSVGSGGKKDKEEEEDDFYYKNGEFFLDSLFMMSTMYERYGDGLGCFIFYPRSCNQFSMDFIIQTKVVLSIGSLTEF